MIDAPRSLERTTWLALHGMGILKRKYSESKEITWPNGEKYLRFCGRLDKPERASYFFNEVVESIGAWVAKYNIAVLTGQPRINRYMQYAARQFDIPAIFFGKKGGDFITIKHLNGGQGYITRQQGPVGIIYDELTTGRGLLRFAATAPGISNLSKRALAIIDCGQPVPGVYTAEEVGAYQDANPTSIVPHMVLPFACDAMLELNAPLLTPLPKEQGRQA